MDLAANAQRLYFAVPQCPLLRFGTGTLIPAGFTCRSPEMESVVSEVKAFNKHASLKSPGTRHMDIHATATSLHNQALVRSSRHSSRATLHQLTDHSSSGSDSPRGPPDLHCLLHSPSQGHHRSPSVSARRSSLPAPHASTPVYIWRGPLMARRTGLFCISCHWCLANHLRNVPCSSCRTREQSNQHLPLTSVGLAQFVR